MTDADDSALTPPEHEPRYDFVRYSSALLNIPEDEMCKVIEQFEAAIRNGTVTAVRDKTKRFKAEYRDLNDQLGEYEHPEEYIQLTEQWSKWLAEQRLASRYHLMKIRNDFSITTELLETHPEQFEVIAQMRREALQQKHDNALNNRQKRQHATFKGNKLGGRRQGKRISKKNTK